MQMSACENNQLAGKAGTGIDLLEIVRENARRQVNNQQKIVVGPATLIVMRPRAKSNDKTKTLAAFSAIHYPFTKAFEEQKTSHNVPSIFSQSAAANQAANAGADVSSSESDSFESSSAVSLRFTSDSEDEEYVVPEFDTDKDECA